MWRKSKSGHSGDCGLYQEKKKNRKKKPVNEHEIGGVLELEGDKDQPDPMKQDMSTKSDKIDNVKQMEVAQTSNQKEKPNVFNSQNVEATYDIDRGEIQSNYLKLISGTNLEEEQNSNYVYDLKHGQQSDSSEEEEESSSKDMDYADEESSEASEEYASVDSEEIYSDD